VKELEEGRFKVKFITHSKVKPQSQDNKYFECGYTKPHQSKECSENNDLTSVWSTKAGTIKDVNRSPQKESTAGLRSSIAYLPKFNICDDWDFLQDNY
jgi:hypothetical protein